MNKKKKLEKSLQSIALGYTEGSASVDILIKACDKFKALTNFEDDYSYQIKVSKSCFDFINNVPQDSEICKAIIPGQTKVIDGVMYIYSATKSGSKNSYDWHVVQKGAKTGKTVGAGSKMDDKKKDEVTKFVNSLFPKDLSSLKVVNSSIGGSTGAKLVQDVNGNQYIMKRGDSTNNDHVRSEYLTNQLYSMIGIKVPKYELYDDNGTNVLLSKFIPMAKPTSHSDNAELAKGFMADVLLANWDVYQNDNCLVDSAGRVIRVDNGSGLNFRAQGRIKRFDADVQTSYNGMVRYNPGVFGSLTESDYKKQVSDLISKKNDIIDFLKESGEDELAAIIGKRISNLNKIFSVAKWIEDFEKKPIKPRNVKSDDEQYADLDEKALADVWSKANGKTASDKIKHLDGGSNGSWSLLNKICDLRGFNGLPNVVTDDEYWKLAAKNSRRVFCRGISPSANLSLEEMADSAMNKEECYYGHLAAYGQGIYVAGSSAKQTVNPSTYKDIWQSQEAYRYSAQNGKGFIMNGIFADNTKFITYKDLYKEAKDYIPADDGSYSKIKKEIKKLDEKIEQIQSDIDNFDLNIEKNVYKRMNYDEIAITSMMLELESVDWGKTDAFGERDIPSFKDFVEGKMATWVKEQGGSNRVGKNTVYFKLPNSDEELVISKMQYEGEFAITKKNIVTPHENYAAEKFLDWMQSQHMYKVQDEVNREKDLSGDSIIKMKSDLTALKQERGNKQSKVVNSNNFGDNVMDQVAYACQRGDSAALGLFAALKGYDVIEAEVGGDNIYYAVVNRTKMIFSNKIVDSSKY